MSAQTPWMGLCQIAMSVADVERSQAFYEEMFGFHRSGGTHLFRGRTSDRIQAYKGVRNNVRWMNDRTSTTQLELFEYENPTYRPMREGARACDLGLVRFGMFVRDFDAVLERLRTGGVALVGPVVRDGSARVACVRDPDGAFIELWERDRPPPGPADAEVNGGSARLRSVTISVPDLAAAELFFTRDLGLPRQLPGLHAPETEAAFGLPGAERTTALFSAGGLFVEAVEYKSPRGRPRREDVLIADAGLFHVALRCTNGDALESLFAKIEQHHPVNSKPVHFGVATVVYTRPFDLFTLELAHFHPLLRWFIGFRQHGWTRRRRNSRPLLEAT